MKKILYTDDPATRARTDAPYKLAYQIVASVWIIALLFILVIVLVK